MSCVTCQESRPSLFFSFFLFSFWTKWYRPAHTVTFIPATPDGKLTGRLREVLHEEGQRLGLGIRAVEQGGISLKRNLTGGDLKGGELCGQPDCVLCQLGGKGGCHRRAGVVYRETNTHSREIQKKDLENAFAKHLNIYHPEREGDPTVFNIKVMQTFLWIHLVKEYN